MFPRPTSIYINWSTYDELSDDVQLTEAIALRQVQEIGRLQRLGCRFDYYLMDAFWYARNTGYRSFRTPHFPNGPERWLAACREAGVLPGLWLATNNLGDHCQLDLIPAWKDSYDETAKACCLFAGGYLAHLLESMERWYDRGVRMYKFDFANFAAAPEYVRRSMLPSEIRAANAAALRAALIGFKLDHPDCRLLAYNGFEDQGMQWQTDLPLRKHIDTRWLECFDGVYCGDPRPADVPCFNFYRAKDIYSDHMVRLYHDANQYPLAVIDNSAFMIGTTGTCYRRGKHAWKGSLVLALARGSWANTFYGNLDLLSEADGRWFATVQRLFFELQQSGTIRPVGRLPGAAQPYGWLASGENGAVLVLVNASQAAASLDLAALAPHAGTPARLLFADAGYTPAVTATQVTLGPEQLAVLGFGMYAELADLGREPDVVIPADVAPLPADFAPAGERTVRATVMPPAGGHVRIVFQQFRKDGRAQRTSGGAPPNGGTLGTKLILTAKQGETQVPVAIQYDKAIWSGLSWAAGEVDVKTLRPGVPLTVSCQSTDPAAAKLEARVYHVRYA